MRPKLAPPSVNEQAGQSQNIHQASLNFLVNQQQKMSTSPTPSEREAADKTTAAREAEEQAKLPYKWMQTIQDVDLTAQVPGNLKARDFDIKITKSHLRVAVKGQDPIIDVCFTQSYLPGFC
jgi:HSP20 family molecular chaperone IbpA